MFCNFQLFGDSNFVRFACSQLNLQVEKMQFANTVFCLELATVFLDKLLDSYYVKCKTIVSLFMKISVL